MVKSRVLGDEVLDLTETIAGAKQPIALVAIRRPEGGAGHLLASGKLGDHLSHLPLRKARADAFGFALMHLPDPPQWARSGPPSS